MTTEQTREQWSWDSSKEATRSKGGTRRSILVGHGLLSGVTGVLLVVLILLPVLGGLGGLTLAALTPARYTAHAYLLIVDTTQGADASALNIAQATARVATKVSVLEESGGGGPLLRAARAGDLTATASPDAPLVDLAANASTSDDSVQLANEMAARLRSHIAAFSGATRVRAELFASASRPEAPASPNALVNVLIGVVVGMLASAVLLVFRRTN